MKKGGVTEILKHASDTLFAKYTLFLYYYIIYYVFVAQMVEHKVWIGFTLKNLQLS